MDPEKFINIRYKTGWYDWVSMEEGKKYHTRNAKACQAALEYHNLKDRPLEILVIHGSGRSTLESCARELSNSQLLLRGALEHLRKNSKYNIVEISLRAYDIEPCNNCYATASALCGFPCNCFPMDPMQDLYPLVLRCDLMLLSTGVNQSTMSTRLKAFLDRLISLDGGFYVSPEQFGPKDAKWKDHCVALSSALAKTGTLPYDDRMWGRVAAYFITSKDEKNILETATRDFKTPLSYIELTAETLRDGNADYGFFHHPKHWYAGAWSIPDNEMCYDKRDIATHSEFLPRAIQVLDASIDLAEELRRNPPPFDGGARKNRT